MIVWITIEELLYRVVLGGLSLLRCMRKRCTCGLIGDRGKREEFLLPIDLMMIDHDVDSVQGMWWSIVLEGCMSQYTRLLYWRDASLVLF